MKKLLAEELTCLCEMQLLQFDTTAELEPLNEIIGQERASRALKFGLKMKKKGYNIYIAGLSGTGRSSYAKSITKKCAQMMPPSNDWVYVYNFKNPNQPKALGMEAGLGKQFKKDIEITIEQLKSEISRVFAEVEYERKRNEVYKKFQQQNQLLMKKINETGKKHGFLFKDTPQGIITIPLKDGKPISQEDYNNLSVEEIEILREKTNQLGMETLEYFDELKNLEEKLREQIKSLDEKISYDIINYYVKKLIQRYGHRKEITEYINALEGDIVENINEFKEQDEEEEKPNVQEMMMFQIKSAEDFFQRYQVNLFVDQGEQKHAPVIYESNPTFNHLLGTIEYKNEMGVLKTDHVQIKPGALHMANGGFLILQAKDVLLQPYGWETLKRAIKTGEISIESLNKQLGYVVTSTLKPEAIPLDVKVILIGDSYIYQMLYNFDEDFKKLFRTMADFDVEMDKKQESIIKMAQFIAAHCKERDLLQFDKTAVARIIELSCRLADHQDKLSSRFNQIVEILYEADLWAREDGQKIVSRCHVEKAIQEKTYRNNKYEEKLNEMFKDETILLDVEGEKVGQINGLAVMGTGEYSFGKPNRITVSTYRGKSGIINIEREVKKSGSIHDKGVLILSGYLGYKYAQEEPMSLSVSVSFEQNYSIIDGDSASSTELYAILSSIANIPIKQGIAVTGSVNQKGEIQPIGGVNEKIEGFFDVCILKGLTGAQGVIIPKQNIKNLMLKQDVIQAVRDDKFHIYAIGHVDEGIEILTGKKAGIKGAKGNYPIGTVNYFVKEKLRKINSEKAESGK